MLEMTLVPKHVNVSPEFVVVNPTSVIPSAVNVIALRIPASTTGKLTPFSVTDLLTTTFS